MSTKTFVLICLAITSGIIVFMIYSTNNASRSVTSVSEKGTNAISAPVQTAFQIGAPIDEQALPPPVIPSIIAKVTRVSDGLIIIEGKDGEMTLPKDSSVISVFRRSASQTVVSTIEDVRVGMSAEVSVIEPGKKINLILLPFTE